jgi:hypothetical protein
MKTDLPPFLPELYEQNKHITVYEHHIPKGENFTKCSRDYFCPFCKFERDILNKEMNNYFKRRLSDVEYELL